MNAALDLRHPAPGRPDGAAQPRHALLVALLLALMCGVAQAWQPMYVLGPAPLSALGLTVGLLSAGAAARGGWAWSAGWAGALAGAWWSPAAGSAATGAWGAAGGAGAQLWAVLAPWALVGAQSALAGALLRRGGDAPNLPLDTLARLRRLVLVAASAAALLGALGQWLIGLLGGAGSADALPRAAGAHAFGRAVVDWAGIVLAVAVLGCWLARPAATWHPRRLLVAAPLLAALALLLPGLDQVARRDERRLDVRFEQDALARQRRLQHLLTEPVAAVTAMRGMLLAGGAGLARPLFDQQAAAWTTRQPGLLALGWLEAPAGAAPITSTLGGRPGTSAAGEPPLGAVRLVHAHEAAPRVLAALGPPTPEGSLRLDDLGQQALRRALATDAPAAMRLRPVSGPPPVLLLQRLPDDAGGSRRLVWVLVDLQRLLQPALPDADDPNLRVCLFDMPGTPAKAEGLGTASASGSNPGPGLAATPLGLAPVVLAGPPACADAPSTGAFHVHGGRLALADLPLALLSVEPPSADNRIFTAVWLLGLPSVTGLALLASLLLAVTGRMRRIEDRVEERTAALQSEVAERRQAEGALAQSEQRFRAIFDGVNIGVTLVDPGGTIRMANPAFGKMMGCAPQALVGRPLAAIRLPDVAEDDGTAQALGGAQARRQRYLTSDGRVLQVAASLRTLHGATGEPVGTVAALHDLTPVLQLREAERARDEADIASRTKSEFMARLSHELRTPLNAIVGFAQLVDQADVGQDPARLHDVLARIRRTGWHLLDMVNDVLDLSRMEAGSLRLEQGPVNLPEVAQDAAAMLQAAADGAEVRLTLSLSPQAEWVLADTLRLRQVLVNLLGNAITYNRRGGWVQLRTRAGGAGEVLIEVEDNGIGIAADRIDTLFQPFQRARAPGQTVAGSTGTTARGSGIGLVLCQRLVALMGGRIEASSRLGEGSVFSVWLPAAGGPGDARGEVQPRGSVPGAQVSIGQVLYVEDDAADIQALQTLMAQRPGIRLAVAASAAEGLAQAAEADLVLLDLDLPDRPGLELLQQLRADSRLRDLPVIVVSAETRPDRIDACFDAGASAFFSKPLQAAPLLKALDIALQRWP